MHFLVKPTREWRGRQFSPVLQALKPKIHVDPLRSLTFADHSLRFLQSKSSRLVRFCCESSQIYHCLHLHLLGAVVNAIIIPFCRLLTKIYKMDDDSDNITRVLDICHYTLPSWCRRKWLSTSLGRVHPGLHPTWQTMKPGYLHGHNTIAYLNDHCRNRPAVGREKLMARFSYAEANRRQL